MVKYLSGRQKLRPSDKLTEDRYQYLGLDQAEPNLADPATSPGVPSGLQYQLVAVTGYEGRRYWVPVGGSLQPGAITIFDEGTPVSSASSITQVNFVGAAVTAQVSVQTPSGHPGIAATVTVIPVNVGDTPPNTPTPNEGELWWESDTGDLYIYYNDGSSAQWVMANAGGRGLTGDKGDAGDKGQKGDTGLTGGAGAKGDKGEKGAPSTVAGPDGDKGQKGEVGVGDKGQKGEIGAAGSDGDKGQKGEIGTKGEPGSGGSGGASVTISDTAPGSPNNGDLWWESDTFDLHVYYQDGSSNQWVSITSNSALKGEKGDTGTKGQKGEVGSTGSTGDKGQKGEIGPTGGSGGTGAKGDKGQKGQDGADASGAKGQKGEVGADGGDGDKGQKGEVGSGGSAGSDGDKGQKGESGAAASKGQKGEVGADGSDGDKGQKGEVGAGGGAGSKGQKGEVGATGDKGQKGEVGATGSQSFTVTNSGASAYQIDGSNNPTLTLVRGFTYTFNVNASGHPFFIKTSATTGTGNQYTTGVTNNGVQVGTLTFVVPSNAPATLYYICQYHSSMVGTINTVENGQKGEKGQKGDTGAQGTSGSAGSDGDKGQKGEVGAGGSAGSDGSDGDKGQKGEVGSGGGAGSKGQKGEVGAGGSAGSDGSDGDKGQKGEVGAGGGAGDKGQKGEVGAGGGAGDKGQKGEVGAGGGAGSKGQKGEVGAGGSAGSDGDKGQKGEVGAGGGAGSKGQKGEVGSGGSDGSDGDKGQKGEVGAGGGAGSKGQKGEVGAGGGAGSKGQKGEVGEQGGGAPVGQIIAWSGSASSLPTGYFLCDGTAISRTTYADLFTIVGTTHGAGNGSSTFNLPDLRDRFVVGASNSTGDTTYPGVSPGATGGSATDTVNITISGNTGFENLQTGATHVSSGALNRRHTHTFSGSGSDTVNTLPPYYALAYIIQYAQGGDVAKGQKGEVGSTGGTGGTGDKGQKGDKGDVEAQGSKGQKGEKGQLGADGGSGADGDKGQKGEPAAGTNGVVSEVKIATGSGFGGWSNNTNVCSLTINVSSGEKVLLQGNARTIGIDASGDEDSGTGIIRLRRGSTNLVNIQCGYRAMCAAMQYVDTGQSGSVTYHLYVQKTGYESYNSFQVGPNSIVATKFT